MNGETAGSPRRAAGALSSESYGGGSGSSGGLAAIPRLDYRYVLTEDVRGIREKGHFKVGNAGCRIIIAEGTTLVPS